MVVSARFVAPATRQESTRSDVTKRESNSHFAPILLTLIGHGSLSVIDIASFQRPPSKP
jgi:hypothetical protein